MPKSVAAPTVALPLLAYLTAAAVGLWLGFSSCGGYIWQTYFGNALLGLAVLVAAVGPSRLPQATLRRSGRVLAVFAAFFVARGVGFALYLGASTPGEYFRRVGATFGSGLC